LLGAGFSLILIEFFCFLGVLLRLHRDVAMEYLQVLIKGLQGVTRMAYSPRLWLMAIGW
jgi:hypothetical protein